MVRGSKKFQLKNGDYIHCVLWNYHFYITGTDIVKILVWRFQNSGRQLGNMKKFEEGVFSDLRNLKPGIDASLERPRSEFLEFLYKNGCIRTQKKQKVFYWYSVPHDALFCDALERDMRRDNTIYNYNGYPADRRVPYQDAMMSQSYVPYSKTSQQLFNSSFEQPRKMEKICEIKNDLFNIKSTLFGDTRSLNGSSSIPINFSGNSTSNSVANRNVAEAQNSELSFDKLFSLNPEPKIPQLEDYEDESKMRLIRSKIGADLRKKFDDFDLNQLGFLKERCQEYFGFGKEVCEKKKIPDNLQAEESGVGASAKVRFVGMNNSEINE
ncbi:uncharacterized protein VICG_01897 [Vittaforma corneae ATCC 50505]|uniref:Uncharacterized protein n=1 Tax=Vittaforma corneae (strain ATCC 50505) TaxID=993615 RepID=L2GKG9_VITCO|nr:uncharacterized protein VICG_01897 [Vittaforma corneae ATCC 50505]ELA41104.1 hypothetical protein VICG_01897 [Vittaforma corneae ATCC 50505]